MKPTNNQVSALYQFLRLLHGSKLSKLDSGAKTFASYLNSLSGFKIVDAKPPHEHVGAAIVDGVLQVGKDYEMLVRPAVDCIKMFPQAGTVSGFISLLNKQPLSKLVKFKSARVKYDLLRVARFFAHKGIDTFEQLYDWLKSEKHRDQLLTLKRDPHGTVFSVGDKTADYFRRTVGHWDAVAVDKGVRQQLNGAGIVSLHSGKYTYKEKRSIVQLAALHLGHRPIDLDNSIYIYYVKGKSQTKLVSTTRVHSKGTKYCIGCGAKIPRTAKYCSECGIRQP